MIGSAHVDCLSIIDNPEDEIDDWFDLKVGDEDDVQGSIHIKVKFHPKGSLEEDESKFLPCYFPMRQNNRVTMYQVSFIYIGVYSTGVCIVLLRLILSLTPRILCLTSYPYFSFM